MNYIKEMRCFQALVPFLRLNPSEQALWHTLFELCNSLNWKKCFTIAIGKLSSDTNISRSGIIKARARLTELGLIKYTSRNGNIAEYELYSLVERYPHILKSSTDLSQDSSYDSGHGSSHDSGHGSSHGCGLLNKQNKNINKNKTKSLSDLIDGFTKSLTLRLALSSFIDFRSNTGAAFNRQAFRLFLAELRKFGTDEQMTEAVNRSLRNGWKSLVPEFPSHSLSPNNARATPFSNFTQPEYDYDAIERRALGK